MNAPVVELIAIRVGDGVPADIVGVVAGVIAAGRFGVKRDP